MPVDDMTLVRPNAVGSGNADVSARFAAMQERFKTAFSEIFDDPLAKRTVLIVPSLTVDADVMAKIAGVYRYEERMLCLLLLLRMPQTNVIYVTSSPICETIVDYYLHLLPGIPSAHARRRLTLLSCEDAAPVALSRKILDRPRLIERIKAAIPDTGSAHMTCFTVTELERELALRLDLPVYGCDPELLYWGTKSGSRRIFREAGIPMAPGFEDLSTPDDVARALAELKKQCPDLDKAVVKINEGFSGEGNAVISLKGAPQGSALLDWVRSRLSQMAFEAGGMTWDLYQSKLKAMGAIVEAFIPGEVKESPSVQFRVDPLGRLEAISTHDQVLGGTNQQIFLGCRFPARADYRLELQELATSAAKVLASKGVLGRFGLDFISVKEGDAWKHYAIEINLRKGGTTHPFLMLQFLTDGRYDAQSGEFLTPSGRPRCYFASDNLESERYRGLCSDDLIDIAVKNGLHFHAATGEGVAFHLIGALSQFGKLGVVCIGETQERADALYRKTVAVLDAEGGADAEKR
ncbi:MAG: peptide ligase PGM1-related protein [Hyphomicrobiaceae bacterium]